MHKTKLILFVTLITIISTEIILRLLGYTPGIYKNYKDFKLVDKIYTTKNYTTDEFGIYKFDDWVTDTIKKYYSFGEKIEYNSKFRDSIDWMDGINDIYRDYKQLELIANKSKHGNPYNFDLESIEWNSEFTNVVNEIFLESDSINHWQKLIKNYIKTPFNSDGFRSVEFDTTKTKNIRILLIGDSFAYGMSSTPFFNSYADILLSRGYIMYNTGIAGVDPSQYAAIAKKYIKKLTPDIVIVNFYPGNDLMSFPRESNKNEPHEHMTNAGFFESNPLGKYLSPEETYSYYLSLIKIPNNSSTFNIVCSKSSILSIVWGGLYNLQLVNHPIVENYDSFRAKKPDTIKAEITSKYIMEIASVCEKYNTKHLFTIIPNRDSKKNIDSHKKFKINKQTMDKVFKNNKYYYPEYLTFEDYNEEDDFHFNNSGSLKYANFLDTLIQMQYIHSN